MQKIIRPAAALSGTLGLPGDKSISHRYAILASLAEGPSRIHNYSTGADCHSTLNAVRALGIQVEEDGTTCTVHGAGLHGWRQPAAPLDAGNSGSAMRMLAGPLAAQPFDSTLIGDESLSGRPMKRILGPLAEMGASIEAREGNYPPLRIRAAAAPLRGIDYTLPVASAQVKTCILLAGLFAQGVTTVREPVRSRDHTEIALREFGAELSVERRVISLQPGAPLQGRELLAPADLSSAAFFLVAALLVPGSDLTLRGVGL
ncbi:MAG TPA: 3-phosphoshikimate 1-carboxyvinyltransferase, partial [Solibacterales bacterium]|nr:3-phosphoshikimate 1-carboxyvinyltransferase [Bryobacterales bacterium]